MEMPDRLACKCYEAGEMHQLQLASASNLKSMHNIALGDIVGIGEALAAPRISIVIDAKTSALKSNSAQNASTQRQWGHTHHLNRTRDRGSSHEPPRGAGHQKSLKAVGWGWFVQPNIS